MFDERVRGPRATARARASLFAPELEALAEHLARHGYSRATICNYVTAAEHLAGCIQKQFVSLDGLTIDDFQRFAKDHAIRCHCESPRHRGSNFISVSRHFFRVLIDHGRCSQTAAAAQPMSSVDVLLEQFDRHLRDNHGLADSTRVRYLQSVRPLLEIKFGRGEVDASKITVRDVRSCVSSRAILVGPRTLKKLTTATRSLLRFLVFQGAPLAHVARAVPVVPAQRMSGLPRALSDEQLRRLIASVDLSTPIGLRARATIECASSLGLRAGEIAALRIHDIDWRRGMLHLPKTKARRAQTMPLMSSVGKTLAAYLRHGRPTSSSDRIFVRHAFRAGVPLASVDIGRTVRRAVLRAGLRLPSSGTHALRHTTATRLVRAGVAMKDIADVMRHRDIDTTQIYARVDWPRLTEVASPWPTASAP